LAEERETKEEGLRREEKIHARGFERALSPSLGRGRREDRERQCIPAHWKAPTIWKEKVMIIPEIPGDNVSRNNMVIAPTPKTIKHPKRSNR
jgi:hypothetical protein